MDSNQLLVVMEKLEFLDILTEALFIMHRNACFIIFTLFTTLPFLSFMVFFETFLQTTAAEASNLLQQTSHGVYYDDYYYWSNYWPGPFYSATRFASLLPKLVQLCVLYLVPYHLLELFNLAVVVDVASKIYAGEAPVTLREMIHTLLYRIVRLKGPFITSLYVLFFSTSTLLGMLWLVLNYHILSISVHKEIVLTILHGLALIGLVTKYLEWSGGWNMGMVISLVEEEVYGAEALDLSAYYGSGSTRRGQLVMLVFFVWALALRLLCYQLRDTGFLITSALIGLVYLGHVMKWVSCMVYFFDCRTRILEKKVDDKVAGVKVVEV